MMDHFNRIKKQTLILLIATTILNSTQSWVGLIFLRNHNHKPQTEPNRTVRHFFSQLLHNQTRPNSVCNLISTQLEDSCKKIGSTPTTTPTPQKIPKFSKFDFEPILKETFYTNLTPHPITHPTPRPQNKLIFLSSTKLDQIQFATLF